jgi:hypothetical protein
MVGLSQADKSIGRYWSQAFDAGKMEGNSNLFTRHVINEPITKGGRLNG